MRGKTCGRRARHGPLLFRGFPGWGMRRYVRARLHRRLFFAMGVAILFSLLASVLIALWLHPQDEHFDARRGEKLAAAQFARTWDDPAARSELAEQLSEAFSVALVLKDDHGRVLSEHGGRCTSAQFSIPVAHGERPLASLGKVEICVTPGGHDLRTPLLVIPFVFGIVLWISSGLIAHRLGRPLGKLVEVTREIGAGQLKSRARLGRHETGELGALAESINEMAARIEKQLEDQKELLAAVSHEMRTPLTRLRVIGELLEEGADFAKLTEDMQREITELDDLIGQLLANSRLEFHALRKEVQPADALARLALVRCGLSEGLLEETGFDDLVVSGDATLLQRALLNLLHNGQSHGGGVVALSVRARGDRFVEFSVRDRGPGFVDQELPRVFESFYRGGQDQKTAGTLGLGLSLVRRIARAHGGDAQAENTHPGARISFWIERAG